MLKLILASLSPRRRDLLESVGFDFEVQPVKVSEIIDENLNPRAFASQIATRKALASIDQNNYLKSQGYLVLSADTIVALGDQIFGKPQDEEEACQILDLLSGKSHSVLTAMTFIETGSMKRVEVVDETLVQFRKLTQEEIRTYVQTKEPMDKAGAYGIQGLGAKLVASYTGSWSNVVGLPLEKLTEVIDKNGWLLHRKKS